MKIGLVTACILATVTVSFASSSKHSNHHHYQHKQQEHHRHRHYNPYRHLPPWENVRFPGGFVIVPDKNNNGGGVPREVENGNLCPDYADTLVGDMLTSFTGTFFNDFYTGGGHDILGPLAVGGDFTAPGYVVNANEETDCSANIYNSFDSYGLVVGGVTDTLDTDVHGSAFLAGGGDSSEVHVQNPPCRVYETEGTARYDFDQAQQAAKIVNKRLASATPNLLFQNQGELVSLANGGNNDRVKIMTFNTCNNGNCPVADALSDPTGIFFNNGNYNGPYGDVPTPDQTIVFNIPVTVGTTLRLNGNQPSLGFNSCKTIYNFYPVDENGEYVDDGTFTLVRDTGSQLEGYTIAPQAHIRDAARGTFAGAVIGLDYTWDNFPTGVEIHDFPAAGCPAFDGCLPIFDEDECPPPSTVTLTETQTQTEAAVTLTITDEETLTVPVTVTDVEIVPTTTTVINGITVSVTVTDHNGPATTVTDVIIVEEPCHDHKKGHKCKNKKGHKKNKYDKWNDKEKSWWQKKGGGKKWAKYDDDEDDDDNYDEDHKWERYNNYNYYDNDEDEWEGYYGDEDGW